MNINTKNFRLSFIFHVFIFILLISSSLIDNKYQNIKNHNTTKLTSIYLIAQKSYQNKKTVSINIKNKINKKQNNKSNKEIKKEQKNRSYDSNYSFNNAIKDQSFLLYKTPIYPKVAIKNNQQGEVIVNFLVSTNNIVKKIVIYKSSGYVLLDKSVIDTAKYWKPKKPITKDTWFQVKVAFLLK